MLAQGSGSHTAPILQRYLRPNNFMKHLLAIAFLLGLFTLAGAAHATCAVGVITYEPSGLPNPNLAGPPFVDGCPLPAAALNQLPTQIAHTTALRATSTVANPSGVWRMGFAAVGDTEPLFFKAGSGACSTDDGASCVNSSNGNHWNGAFTSNGVDPRQFGAQCGGTVDATAAFNAIIAANPGGVVINVPSCVLLIAGTITLTDNIHLRGTAGFSAPTAFNPRNPVIGLGQPTTGSVFNITSTSLVPLNIIGTGDEVEFINFFYPNQVAPGSGAYTPTIYPWTIQAKNNPWNAVNLHDLTFTANTHCIDLEGEVNYSSGTSTIGSKVEHIYFNPCMVQGIRLAQFDNDIVVHDLRYDFWWGLGSVPFGQYTKTNKIDMNLCYIANAQITDVKFTYSHVGMLVEGCSVIGGFGHRGGTDNLQMSNISFNETCSGINLLPAKFTASISGTTMTVTAVANGVLQPTMPVSGAGVTANTSITANGTGTGGVGTYTVNNSQTVSSEVMTEGDLDSTGQMTNILAFGDSSTDNCPVNFGSDPVFFDMNSVFADWSFNNLKVGFVQTLAAAKSGANLTFNNINMQEYSHFAAGANAFKIDSGAAVYVGGNNFQAMRPNASAGTLVGPGPSATQGYFSPIQVGGTSGTASAIDGGVTLQSSGNNTHSGFLSSYYPNNTRAGYVGHGTQSSSTFEIESDLGAINLMPKGGANAMTINSVSGKLIINVSGLPISCTGQATGTLWANGSAINFCP